MIEIAHPTAAIKTPDPGTIIKWIDFVKKCIDLLASFLSEEGTVDVYGIQVTFKTKPKTHGFPPQLRYYCKVRAEQYNIEARADNLKSKSGARKHAVENLANKLADAGIIRR